MIPGTKSPLPAPLDVQERLGVRGLGVESDLSPQILSRASPAHTLLTPWSTAWSKDLKGPGTW